MSCVNLRHWFVMLISKIKMLSYPRAAMKGAESRSDFACFLRMLYQM